MNLTKKQKKAVRKTVKKHSLSETSRITGITQKEILDFLKNYWPNEKYEKFLLREGLAKSSPFKSNLKNGGLFSPLFANWKKILLLVVLIAAVYANSLQNEFMSDDTRAIVENRHLGELSSVFSSPIGFLRPLTYYFIYHLGGLNPLYFRLFNIGIHALTTILIFLIISLMFDDLFAFISASLFAVHPVLVESVAWISGGNYAQYAFFALCSFWLFLNFDKKQKISYLIFSILFFLMALLTSQTAVILPLILGLYLVLFADFKRRWHYLLPYFLLSLVFGFIILKGIGARTTTFVSEYALTLGTHYSIFFKVPVAVSSYLKLLFLPIGLSFYHTENVYSSFQFAMLVLGLIALLSLIVFFWKKNKLLFFWLCFFLIALVPFLHPFAFSFLYAERYVYFASLGIIVFQAAIIKQIGSLISDKYGKWVLLSLVVFIFSLFTMNRNKDWKNKDSLALASAKTSPSSAENRLNMGDYYERHGETEKAIAEFEKAIEMLPNYADAYLNTANIYKKVGKTDKAIEYYKKAYSFNPNLWKAHFNLAVLYFEQNDYINARLELEKAVEINQDEPKMYSNLAVLYLQFGEKEKAIEALTRSLKLEPTNENIQKLLQSLKEE